MIDIIDKVLRKEEDRKICSGCSNAVPEDKDRCPSCGYSFDTNASKPEKGFTGSSPEDGLTDG